MATRVEISKKVSQVRSLMESIEKGNSPRQLRYDSGLEKPEFFLLRDKGYLIPSGHTSTLRYALKSGATAREMATALLHKKRNGAPAAVVVMHKPRNLRELVVALRKNRLERETLKRAVRVVLQKELG